MALFNNSSSPKEKNRPILSVFLVFVESILAIVLRLDKRLRQTIYPLVQQDMVVCLRTYLPHVQVYVRFTENGILLDTKPPQREDLGVQSDTGQQDADQQQDVIVSSSLLALIKLFLTSDDIIMQKLQFRGNHHDVELVKSVFENMRLQHMTGDLIGSFRKLDIQTQNSQNTLNHYKKQLTTQQETIAQLNLALHEAEAALKHQAKRETLYFSVLIGLGVLCMVLAVLLLM